MASAGLLYIKSLKMLRASRAKSGRLQLPSYFLLGNDTKIPNAPHVRDIRNPTVGPLVTIPITFSRHTRPSTPPFFLSPALSYETSAIRSIDRRRRRRRAGKTAEEGIACLLAPRKGLNPRHSAGEDSTGQSHPVGEIAVTITESTKEEGARPDRTSPLSRTRRTGCCIPEVILWSE